MSKKPVINEVVKETLRLRSLLKEQEKTITSLTKIVRTAQSLKAREEEVKKREVALAEEKEWIHRNSKELVRRNIEEAIRTSISGLDKIIDEKGSQLRQKEEELGKLEVKLGKRKAELNQLGDIIKKHIESID
jgi:uncharacterized protein (DUF3084 family)